MSNQSAFGSFARKAIGFVILAFVALFLLQAVVGAVVGIVKLLFAIALVVVAAGAVVWVLRKL
jgi:hypothetical protein